MNKVKPVKIPALRILVSILLILTILIAPLSTVWANTPPISENKSELASNNAVFHSINEGITLAAQKTVTPGIKRLAGSNRYKTCLEVAKALKDELGSSLTNKKFDSIIVASGQAFPDALSGTYAANKTSAPILIVSNNGNNSEMIAYAKNNINTGGTIYVLGGESAVSKSIFNSLKGVPGVTVKRLEGPNRYDTNIAILEEMKPEGEDLLICSGKSFPDALSASATGKPILLVGDSLTAAQKKWLKDNISKIKNIYIIGGSGAVSTAVEASISSYKGGIQRVQGSNRYQTSIAVAKKFFTPTPKEVVMASGRNFPDGLVGGPLAYAKGCPLILSDNTSFYTAYKHVFSNTAIVRATILGGDTLISNDASGLTTKGERKTGLLSIGKDKYYADSNGNLTKNKFLDVGGSRYYFTSSGAAYRDTIFKINGKWYGATASGALGKNGWGKCGRLTYFFSNYIIDDVCIQAKAVLDNIGYDLKAAYKWPASNITYISMPYNKNWGSLWFAGYGFTKRRGNCYVFAGTFYVMGKMLGYDIKQVGGTVYARNPYTPHSWTLITQNGKTTIYDPEFYWEHRTMAFGINNGDTRWKYNSGATTLKDKP